MDFSKFIFKKSDVYSSKYYFYNYNNNCYRVVYCKSVRGKGFEEQKKNTLENVTTQEEITRVSLSRTKRNIRELALCNNFEYFATFTINSEFADRFHLQDSQDKLKKILHKVKRNNKDFKFLIITEKHKNGAFHFHGLVSNIDDFYTNQNNYLSSKSFDFLGFNSFSKIKDYTKCCNYILKYITKDCVKNENNQIYISSRGLKKAEKTEINEIDIDWGFINDYCKIRDFTCEELTVSQKLDFLGL